MSRLQSQCLDGVILNAGILHSNALNNLDVEAIRQQFEINALAPLRLVSALTSNLSSGSWIALMTSRMGSIADNSSGGSYGYRMSKAALNIAGKSLAIDLKPQGIAVVILHPGLVATRMINYNPSGISPQQSVEGLLKRIDALTLETSGSFWHANGDVLPW
jgi:NAD(P)-dependent dehydrogenase (short-subunit alcohol dehydrogenase family)